MWSDALWKLKLAAELEESRRGPRPERRRRGSPPLRRGVPSSPPLRRGVPNKRKD
jgi:hypothetical protein